MFIDYQHRLCDAQAFSSDATSSNIIDLSAARNIFDGEPMCVMLTVDVAADFTSTDETYEFQIETDDSSSFGSPTDLLVHSILASALTADSKHILPIPVGAAVEQYLRLYFNGGGTTPTVTLTADLIPLSMVDKFKTYADNSAIQ